TLPSYIPITTPLLFIATLPPPPRSPLFPYTTLFRSPLPEDAAKTFSKDELYPVLQLLSMHNKFFEKAYQFLALQPTELCPVRLRSEEHTSELQSRFDLVCRLLLEKKKKTSMKR